MKALDSHMRDPGFDACSVLTSWGKVFYPAFCPSRPRCIKMGTWYCLGIISAGPHEERVFILIWLPWVMIRTMYYN